MPKLYCAQCYTTNLSVLASSGEQQAGHQVSNHQPQGYWAQVKIAHQQVEAGCERRTQGGDNHGQQAGDDSGTSAAPGATGPDAAAVTR